MDAACAAGVVFGAGVYECEAGHARGVRAGEEQRDAPAKRVADEHDARSAQRASHSFEVAHVVVPVVAPARVVRGVAVPAQVEREHAVVRCETRRERVPNVRLVAEAVQQQQRHAVGAPLERAQRVPVGAGESERARLHDAQGHSARGYKNTNGRRARFVVGVCVDLWRVCARVDLW